MSTSTRDPAIVLTILVAAVVLVGLFAWVLFRVISAALSNSQPYLGAVGRARSDPRVLDALGTPVQAGLPQGSLQWDLVLGNRASLTIPLSGPRASGHLFVRARGRCCTWNYTQIQLSVRGRDTAIDLTGPAQSTPDSRDR